MGRPTRCVPQSSPFLRFGTGLTATTTSTSSTTIAPENLNKYINIPISGFACPPGAFATTSTTSTTLSPLELDDNITECSLYNVSIIFEQQEIDINLSCNNNVNIAASDSAVIRYQPCGSGVFLNQIIYQNKDFCVVKDNIRLLSGEAEITKISSCQNPKPCDIIITELICDLQIKNITCDLQIEVLSL